MIEVVVFALIVLILLYYIYGPEIKKDSMMCPCGPNEKDCTCHGTQETFTPDDPEADPYNYEPNNEYLDDMVSNTFKDGERHQHMAYVAKRKRYGDFSNQLWGINDSTRGYLENRVGFNRMRAPKLDPTSPIQPGTTSTDGYADPHGVRIA